MKFGTTLFFIFTMLLMVSCGGDSKKSSSGSNLNGYRISTFNAFYTPTKQYQVIYGNKLYNLQPYGNAAMQLQQLQSTTANAVMSGTSQYRQQSIAVPGGGYVAAFRVRIVGTIGNNYSQYPTQYNQQYPTQTGTGASNVITVQSIQILP